MAKLPQIDYISAEVWLSDLRIGFAAYDPVDERLWARVVPSIDALEEASGEYLRARDSLRECDHDDLDRVNVYVNDGHRRRGCSGMGFHWPARYCRTCSIVTEPTRPFTLEGKEYEEWRLWQPRWGKPRGKAEHDLRLL